MSLLLDALKRAEDAKRAKAEAAAGSQVGQDEAQLGAASISAESPADAASEISLAAADAVLTPTPSPSDPAAAPDIPVLSLEIIDDTPASASPDTTGASPDDNSIAQRLGDGSSAPMSLEDLLDSELGVDRRKSEPAPPTPAATAAFRAARLQASPPPAELLAPISAPPTISIEPMTSSALPTQETPQQASNREAIKNAFAVKQAAQPSSKARWIVPLAGVIVAAIGAGGWYVWTEMNRFNKPMVARIPAQPVPPPAPVAQAPSSTPSTAPAGQAVAGVTKPNPTSEETNTAAKVPAGKVEDDVAGLPPLLPPPATQLKEERAATAPKIVSATPREAFARRIEALPAVNSASAPEKVVLKPATVVAPQLSPAISAGYNSLAAGDYATAKRRYAEAIAANNNSADAHLGFATAAARSGEAGDLELAIRHYQRVLEIDPRNSTARAALIVLAGGPSSDASAAVSAASSKEAELKLLIAQDPNAANAHFLLGSLYADAKRWRDAQPAFFEAAKLAPQNADYSYNLAVSLDNLGQAAAAANFYRRALVATTKGQFDIPTVERRIALLTAATKDAASKR